MEDKENILDFIFEARSEKLAKINKEDREFLNSPKANIDKAYLEFTNILGKIPTETRKEILEKFNNYSDMSDYIHGYFCKKYYKNGFRECMRLIWECGKI